MSSERTFLVDVGMGNLPFPIRVNSKSDPNGQYTIATISISARIMHDFEAQWIDRFIRILHRHHGKVGTETLRVNVFFYVQELRANTVKVNFEFPYFMEKQTPVSKEACWVRYMCNYSAKATELGDPAKITFRVRVPVLTTYPAPVTGGPKRLFGQLSMVTVECESAHDLYIEDIVDIVERHALSPVYTFLSDEDQLALIDRVHAHEKSSLMMLDEIKEELARTRTLEWFAVQCSNHGMLHSYTTVIGTEKSPWIAMTGYEDEKL